MNSKNTTKSTLVTDAVNGCFRELISAEEGKLAVSRSLLDLKLEHSKLLERFESDRYALTTDLLAAKNEVVELEMR